MSDEKNTLNLFKARKEVATNAGKYSLKFVPGDDAGLGSDQQLPSALPVAPGARGIDEPHLLRLLKRNVTVSEYVDPPTPPESGLPPRLSELPNPR